MQAFFITTRAKIALALFIIGILDIVAVFNLSKYYSSLTLYISLVLFSLLLWIPEFRYFLSPAQKIWSKWDSLQESAHQQRRIQRAIRQELTYTKLNRKQRYATFAGNQGGSYLTTLTRCTCMDFTRRDVPCKHMYYLAIQLGLMDTSIYDAEYDYDDDTEDDDDRAVIIID